MMGGMMVNRHRGEVAARLDGRDWTLCLTLGALAELESAFETDNLSELTAHHLRGASRRRPCGRR